MKELLERLKLADSATYQRTFDWLKSLVWDLIKEDPERYFLESGPYPLRDALLQVVLQDAIAVRGQGLQQDFTPWYHKTRRYKAFVSVGPQNGDLKEGYGDSPVKALLQAYLSALEAA